MVKALRRESLYLSLGICAIVTAHYAAFFSSLYWRYRWLDIPMHFVCGVWLAFFAYYLFFSRGAMSAGHPMYEAIVVVGFAVLGGVLWEFHEFIGDLFVRAPVLVMQAGVGDTMKDLLFDMAGASVAAIMRNAVRLRI